MTNEQRAEILRAGYNHIEKISFNAADKLLNIIKESNNEAILFLASADIKFVSVSAQLEASRRGL